MILQRPVTEKRLSSPIPTASTVQLMPGPRQQANEQMSFIRQLLEEEGPQLSDVEIRNRLATQLGVEMDFVLLSHIRDEMAQAV